MKLDGWIEWSSVAKETPQVPGAYHANHEPCGTMLNLPLWLPVSELVRYRESHMRECPANEVSASVSGNSQRSGN